MATAHQPLEKSRGPPIRKDDDRQVRRDRITLVIVLLVLFGLMALMLGLMAAGVVPPGEPITDPWMLY